MTPSELVTAVRAWQANPKVHPLTCRNDSAHRPLQPMEDAGGVVLLCPDCDYRQTYIPPSVQRAYLSGILGT